MVIDGYMEPGVPLEQNPLGIVSWMQAQGGREQQSLS